MNWKREIELCDLALESDQRNCMDATSLFNSPSNF